MKDTLSLKILKKLLYAGLALIIVVLIGTIAYWFIGSRQYSILNCLYMTVITIATIGYKEIIDLSCKPGGRVFTIFLAFSGIGILTYVFSSFTAFAVEGELKETFRRRKMEKMIKKLKNHFIVCGIEKVGLHIVNELHTTKRPYLI
ncbi:MAG: two pore domain potassium channel family protein, partial [Candidatus Cloacimonetes bacterium]|nr:two pore domain potassium channel family protein [Candidatus Cloacimonadota bacterium]